MLDTLTYPESDAEYKRNYLKNNEDYQYFVNQGVDKEIKGFYSKKKKPSIIGSKEFIKDHQ